MTNIAILPTRSPILVTRLLFGILGLCLLIAAGITAYQKMAFIKLASSAEGTAIQSGFGPAHPNIRFTTSTGRVILFSQGGAVRVSGGEHVKVLYDTRKPAETACIDQWGALYFTPALLAVIGIFMGAILAFPSLFVRR